MSNASNQDDEREAALSAVVDCLLCEAEGMGIVCTVKVWSWVDGDGEPRVSAKTIPYDQLYVTYEPEQPWPSSVTASTSVSHQSRRDP